MSTTAPSLEQPTITQRTTLCDDVTLSERSTVLVGIGGHTAPPNSRLYSYILPAIELAVRNSTHQTRLLLTSSVLDKRERNYANRSVEVQTFAKIHSLLCFIREFFPNAFDDVNIYLGETFVGTPDALFHSLWNQIAEYDPGIAEEAREKECRWRITDNSLVPYACKHALWFRDCIASDDAEIETNSTSTHTSLGGKPESFFNRVRRAITKADDAELSEILRRNISTHKNRLQVVVNDSTVTPYGEITDGRGERRKSLEHTLAKHDTPFSPHKRVASDVQYTVSSLERLLGISAQEFQKFWEDQRTAYQRVVGELEIYLQHFQGSGYRQVLTEIGTPLL